MLTMIAAALLSLTADDAEIAALLRQKGAKIVESAGAATSVEAGDCSSWTDDDFRKLGGLGRLKSLSLGAGLTDARLELLSGLAELESVQTNLAEVSDEGVQGFAGFKNLKTLKFFHPGKTFTGAGLSKLADLPKLSSLTVAGSLAFGDEGMAAVATLTHLREFRSWHSGFTLEGVRKLTALKDLKSLTLGQRLSYTPPTSVSNETLDLLAGMPSLETLQLEEARLIVESVLQLKTLAGLKKLTLEGIDLSEADVQRVRTELAPVDVKWTAPNPAYEKRIRALFGQK